MKVGSLVVCIRASSVDKRESPRTTPHVKWRPIADEKTIYTIRGIYKWGVDTGVWFEEGIIGYTPEGHEIGIYIERCKEVQPPISSEEIAELVEDACCVEVVPQKQGVF